MSKGLKKEAPSVNPFQGPVVEALAAWLHMESCIKLVEAETLRGNQPLAEQYRQQAHDMLDAHMTAKQSAIALGMDALTNGKSR